MVILVTGSSGFAGEALVTKLKKENFDVIGLDIRPGNHTDLVEDITKPFQIKQKIDTVIHLAGRLENDRSSKPEYFSVNVEGTKNVLELAKKNNAYFIYLSTTAIYGRPEGLITENTKIDPIGYYALTKWEGEKVCKTYEEKGLDVSIVRSSGLLGEKRMSIYNIIFKNLFRNYPIPLLGTGKNKISYTHIEDLTDFLIYLTKKRLKDLTVNFGMVPGDLNYIINELIKYTASKSKIVHFPLWFTGILVATSVLKLIPVTPWQISLMHKNHFCDDTKLLSTGFTFKHQPMDGLKAMVDYYKFNILNKK